MHAGAMCECVWPDVFINKSFPFELSNRTIQIASSLYMYVHIYVCIVHSQTHSHTYMYVSTVFIDFVHMNRIWQAERSQLT